jgi:hypothetical protein
LSWIVAAGGAGELGVARRWLVCLNLVHAGRDILARVAYAATLMGAAARVRPFLVARATKMLQVQPSPPGAVLQSTFCAVSAFSPDGR